MKTLLWIQGLSCGANTQSFLCMEHKHLFENIEILYHPLSDKSLEESVRLLLKDEKELDILIVEGAIGKSIRHICSHSFPNIVKILSSKAKYVVALGDCASFGGVHA
ncbi:MAG: Ni/Fe hydrogenase, partial [Hydrogenobaculum sp.]